MERGIELMTYTQISLDDHKPGAQMATKATFKNLHA